MSQDIYDKIMMLAKRRGFIYPSFDIYGGVAGFYDYGPLGSQLKNNIENLWRNFYVLKDKCLEVNTPVVTIKEVLDASGHVDEFTDLTVGCEKCKQSYKVEDLIGENDSFDNALRNDQVKCPNCREILNKAYPINLMFSTKIGIGSSRDAFLRPETAQGIFTNFHFLYRFNREKLPFGVIQIGKGYRNEVSPRQGMIRLREFSMAEAEVFFNPNNKVHPDFNTNKNMKLHLFLNDKITKVKLVEAVENRIINNQALAYYMYITQEFLFSIGINPKKFRFRKHEEDELAHYATECWDAEIFSKRFGWVECVGIADRSAYDLKSHIKSSGTDMYALRKYKTPKIDKVLKIIPKMNELGPLFKDNANKIKSLLEKENNIKGDEITVTVEDTRIKIPKKCYEIVQNEEKVTGERFIPHVIEPSYGVDRIIYMVLEHSYTEKKKKGVEYRVLCLDPKISPIKVGVFPLINDDSLIEIAKKIDFMLRKHGISTYYDNNGTIGRRYARMDEIGTPHCITVDFETNKNNTVTIRDRDTTRQEIIPINELVEFFRKEYEIK
jgi:glycyl-tRNA synthetase